MLEVVDSIVGIAGVLVAAIGGFIALRTYVADSQLRQEADERAQEATARSVNFRVKGANRVVCSYDPQFSNIDDQKLDKYFVSLSIEDSDHRPLFLRNSGSELVIENLGVSRAVVYKVVIDWYVYFADQGRGLTITGENSYMVDTATIAGGYEKVHSWKQSWTPGDPTGADKSLPWGPDRDFDYPIIRGGQAEHYDLDEFVSFVLLAHVSENVDESRIICGIRAEIDYVELMDSSGKYWKKTATSLSETTNDYAK
ncbi:hypothetical protein [Brevibacterium pigmentatum]|uniref:hypothetical protein n=1 Tax=Brevibacterium pigmentatum TaxID=1496080 RepID=UPI001420B2BC|nr:hypothetical protein [Brevibacterium pigmentatum]